MPLGITTVIQAVEAAVRFTNCGCNRLTTQLLSGCLQAHHPSVLRSRCQQLEKRRLTTKLRCQQMRCSSRKSSSCTRDLPHAAQRSATSSAGGLQQ